MIKKPSSVGIIRKVPSYEKTPSQLTISTLDFYAECGCPPRSGITDVPRPREGRDNKENNRNPFIV